MHIKIEGASPWLGKIVDQPCIEYFNSRFTLQLDTAAVHLLALCRDELSKGWCCVIPRSR
jgi:hypothetical protein